MAAPTPVKGKDFSGADRLHTKQLSRPNLLIILVYRRIIGLAGLQLQLRVN